MKRLQLKTITNPTMQDLLSFHRIEGPNDCWVWTRSRSGVSRLGYGQINVHHKTRYTHRLSWEINNGLIPEGMFVCHKCDNPGCFRPDHLFLGTHQDNMKDMANKGRNRGPKPAIQGELAYNARRDVADLIPQIFALRADGLSVRKIGRALRLGFGTVNRVLASQHWSQRSPQ